MQEAQQLPRTDHCVCHLEAVRGGVNTALVASRRKDRSQAHKVTKYVLAFLVLASTVVSQVRVGGVAVIHASHL